MNFKSWEELTNAIIHILQALILAGTSLRCILTIKNCREDEVPWNQIWKRIKGHVFIAIISIVIAELIQIISSYYQ